MSNPQPPTPLWTNQRIYSNLGIKFDAMLDYPTSFNVGLDVALDVAKAIRDDLQERIDQLESQLAAAYDAHRIADAGQEQWTPVAAGDYAIDEGTDDEVLWQVHEDGSVRVTDQVGDYVDVPLVEGWQLMCRTTAGAQGGDDAAA